MLGITDVWNRLANTTQLALVALEVAVATGDVAQLPVAQQAIMDGWRIFEEAFAAELAQELAGQRPPQGAA